METGSLKDVFLFKCTGDKYIYISNLNMILREPQRDENKTIITIMFQICLQNESLSYSLPNLIPPAPYSATLRLLAVESYVFDCKYNFREGGKNLGWMDENVYCKKLQLADLLIAWYLISPFGCTLFPLSRFNEIK